MLRTLKTSAALAALAAALVVTACKDETAAEPEPDVAQIRIILNTAPADTVFVSSTGTVTSGPITISGNTAFTVQYLGADGNPDPVVAGSTDFQTNVIPANTGVVTFTRSSAHAGTLNKVAAGSTTLAVSLFHVVEGHDDFGPFNVNITVN